MCVLCALQLPHVQPTVTPDDCELAEAIIMADPRIRQVRGMCDICMSCSIIINACDICLLYDRCPLSSVDEWRS
jgi:hypothetical protein